MKCTFCKKELPPIGSVTFVHINGDVSRFCSSKCEKSSRMGRDPRKQKWTKRSGK
jgi:large subunit ribosomal protein L24e